MKIILHILQVIFIFLGVGGINKYRITGDFKTLNFAIFLIIAAILSFFLNVWWPLIVVFFTEIIVRSIFYFREDKKFNKKTNSKN